MKKIIVLCSGNSCRSQMAEGYLKKFAGDKAEIYSAGIEADGLNPIAIEIMKEDGIDISGQTSNYVDEYFNLEFDIIVTVCDTAKERCPYLPGMAIRLHQNFTDPVETGGSTKEVLNSFRSVRDSIKEYCSNLAQTYLS